MLGSASVQVLGAGALVFLARLYGPEDFGVLGTYLAVCGMAGVLCLFRYDVAIPLPEDDQEGAHVLALCFGLAIFWSGVAGAYLWGGQEGLLSLFHLETIKDVQWMVPLGILGFGTGQALSSWMGRRGHFKPISVGTGLQGVAQQACQLAMGLKQLGSIGLVVGNFAGQSVAAMFYLRTVWVKDRGQFKEISPGGIFQAAKRYWRFPVVSFWSGCAMALNQYAPILLMQGMFGEAYAGLYLVGQRVLQLPVGLVSKAVGNVFLPEYSRQQSSGKSELLAKGLLEKLLLYGFPFLALLGFTAPVTIPWVFGEKWAHAGWMTAWLTPWMALAFVYAPLSTIPFVKGQQGRETVAQVGLLAARVLPFFLAGKDWEADKVFQLFAFSTGASGAIYLIWIVKLAGKDIVQALLVMGNTLARSAALLVFPLSMHFFFHIDWLTAGAVAIAGLAWASAARKHFRQPGEPTPKPEA